MSEFLKFAYEIISQIVYYIARLAGAAVKLFITGWVDYILIFKTYFFTLNIVGKILSILLMIVLLAIPVLIVYLIVQGTGFDNTKSNRGSYSFGQRLYSTGL